MTYNSMAIPLTKWYSSNKRDLPWRKSENPYVIWVSEIILQQTKVIQGLPYFYKFIEEFPTVKDLAEANEEHLLSIWQGLGYYSRARNMQKAAKIICKELNEVFPETYTDLLKLPGVGKYTAAAIASIAYEEKVAVIDGNVYRVLSRLFEVTTSIDHSKAYKEFYPLAFSLMENSNPRIFNQAIMELGALVCSPKKPECNLCPLSHDCKAFANKTQLNYPVRTKKTKIKTLYYNYVVLLNEGHTSLIKRDASSFWANMYEFPLLETSKEITEIDKLNLETQNLTFMEVTDHYIHKLSHRTIMAKFWIFKTDRKHPAPFKSLGELEKLPKPTLIVNFLNDLKTKFRYI